jgi:hypothetical protein
MVNVKIQKWAFNFHVDKGYTLKLPITMCLIILFVSLFKFEVYIHIEINILRMKCFFALLSGCCDCKFQLSFIWENVIVNFDRFL